MSEKIFFASFTASIFTFILAPLFSACSNSSEPHHVSPSVCKAQGYKGIADYGADKYYGSFCSDGIVHGSFMSTSDGDKPLRTLGKFSQDIKFTEFK